MGNDRQPGAGLVPVLPTSFFSSDHWSEQEQTEAVRGLMQPLFDMQPLDKSKPLTGQMSMFLFGGMVFSRSEFSNHQCVREPSRASLSNFDSILVQSFERGALFGQSNGGEFDISTGTIATFDLSQPYQFQVAQQSRTKSINLVLPRAMLDGAVVSRLHASTLPAGAGMSRLVGDYLRSLKSTIRELNTSELLAAQQITIDMLNTGFRSLVGRDRAKEYAIKEKIVLYIAAHCQEDIGIDFLANKFHVSRATLFRIFLPEGGVSSYIKSVRLQRCVKQLLFSPKAWSASQLALDWGFSNEQQLLRAFKAKYQHSPAQLRRMAAQGIFPLGIDDFYRHLSNRSQF